MNQSNLQQAVNQRQLLTFTYDDKLRVVEPHAYGIDKHGDQVIRAFQVDGESATTRSSWKLFKVNRMVDARIVEGTSAAPRPGYKPGDKVMLTILAQLPDAA